MATIRKKDYFSLRKHLWLSALLLSVWGVFSLYSASNILALEQFGSEMYYVFKQMKFIVLGSCLALVFSFIPIQKLLKFSRFFLWASLALVVLSYIPGFSIRAGIASRWIKVMGFVFQPVELLKVFLLVFVCYKIDFFKLKYRKLNWTFLGSVFLYTLASMALILFQPDYGNAIIILGTFISTLFIGGVSLRIIFGALAMLSPSLVIILFSESYRVSRFLSYLNPWENASDSGYQVVQSFLAFFSGGFFGRGIGASQAKLYFLPEAHTDFIYSIMVEELGVFAVLILFGLYAYLFYQVYKICKKLKNQTHKILVLSLSHLLAVQIIVNIGVVTGLLPTKGLPLPFMSAGGSSLISCFIILGILLSSLREFRPKKK